MKIYLRNGGEALAEDVSMLEQKIGAPLDPDFLEFVKIYNGAEPESAVFIGGDRTQETSEVSVRSFIPIKDIPDEAQGIENLPEQSYPIAYDGTGNYIFIKGGIDGGVFFWDHEQPDDLAKLADSFGGFLEGLEPFDDSVIKNMLSDGDTVWISPDFLDFVEEERRKGAQRRAERTKREGKQE